MVVNANQIKITDSKCKSGRYNINDVKIIKTILTSSLLVPTVSIIDLANKKFNSSWIIPKRASLFRSTEQTFSIININKSET